MVSDENQVRASVSVNRMRAHLAVAEKTGSTKWLLAGVLCDTRAGRLVSTNGELMLISTVRFKGSGRQTQPFIIPRAAIETTLETEGNAKIKPDQYLEVRLSIEKHESARRIVLVFGKQALSTKELLGPYPGYEKIIPRKISGKPSQFSFTALSKLHRVLALAQGKTTQETRIFLGQNGEDPAVLCTQDPELLGMTATLRAVRRPLSNAVLSSVHEERPGVKSKERIQRRRKEKLGAQRPMNAEKARRKIGGRN